MVNADITVIIPVYNEGAYITAFLEALEQMRGQCRFLFVDGGSQDATVGMIEARGFPVVLSPEKGRASQMNYGASLADTKILWFLHADSFPPADALPMIRKVLAKGYRIGCFPIRFDCRHLLMDICAFFSNLRVRLRGIAFGDQGIFLQSALFHVLGGYAPIPLMEDYQLSLDVKKLGCRIGLTKGKITTSDRRFRSGGRLRTMGRMQLLQHRFRRGDAIEAIAKAYRDA